MKIKPLLAGAAILLGSTIAIAPQAGAVVGVVEDPYCFTSQTIKGDTGAIAQIIIYDADGDVYLNATEADGDAYTKAKEISAKLIECVAAETPILDPAVALMGLGVAIPAAIVVKRRRAGAAV